MAAPILVIADAVVSTLNGASLSQTFTAARYYVPVQELKDLGTLTVSVVPTAIDSELIARNGMNKEEYLIDIGVQKVIGTGPMTNDQVKAATDPYMGLMDEIATLFKGTVVVGTSARCVNVKNAPIFVPSMIDEMRLFTSILVLTFRMIR